MPLTWPVKCLGPEEIEPDSESLLSSKEPWRDLFLILPVGEEPRRGPGLCAGHSQGPWLPGWGWARGRAGGRLPTAVFLLFLPLCSALSSLFSLLSLLLPVFLLCFLLEGKGGLEPKWRQLFPRPWGGGRGVLREPVEDLGLRSVGLAERRWVCSSSGRLQASGKEGQGAWHVARSVAWQAWFGGLVYPMCRSLSCVSDLLWEESVCVHARVCVCELLHCCGMSKGSRGSCSALGLGPGPW